MDLNPSSAQANECLAAALCHHGEHEEARKHAESCFRLSPIDPDLHRFHFIMMQSLLGLGEYQEAYRHLKSCLSARPYDVTYLGFETVLLGYLDRLVEARECLDRYLAKRNIRTIDDYRRIFVPNSRLVDINIEGLRKAGWKA